MDWAARLPTWNRTRAESCMSTPPRQELPRHIVFFPPAAEEYIVMLRSRLTRRDFLRSAAAVGAASAFASPALVHARSPNAKLDVAVIGPCGRGSAQLEAAGSLENVVAICDVDQRNIAAVAPKFPKAKTFTRLPQDARRDGEADRRRDGQHARSHPRPAGRHGHADGQALLLREAAGAQRPRSPSAGSAGQGEEPRHADGHADPRRRTTIAAWSSWSNPARSDR